MFEKILYPTDFSYVSKKALDYLVQLREAGTKEIVVLHVIDERGIDAISRYGSGSAETIIGRIDKEARGGGFLYCNPIEKTKKGKVHVWSI